MKSSDLSPEAAPATWRSAHRPWARARSGLCAMFAVSLLALPAGAVDPKSELSQLVHKQWTAADGLSSVGALAVAETPEGYIWVGTEDGVSRFDGREFLNFSARNQTAFADATLVWDFAVAGDGSLWIATDGGLIRHRADGRFERIEGLSSKDVRALAVDAKGTVWAGTSKGLDVVRDGRVVDSPEHRAAGTDAILAIACEPDGTVWLGSPAGLQSVAGDVVRRWGPSDGVPGGVSAIARDRRGTLWAGGPTLIRREGDRFVQAGGDPGQDRGVIRTLFFDRHDVLWIGREGSLDAMKNGVFASADPASPVAGEEIRGMVEDREGNLWVVSHTNGLHMFHDGSFRMMIPDGLKAPLLGVLEARDGAVWMGAYEGGLFRLDGRTSTHFTSRDGIPPGAVWGLYEDNDGGLLVGANGIAQWTGHGFVPVEWAPRGSSPRVNAMLRTARGLWIGQNRSGAYLRSPDGTIKPFHIADGLPSEEVTGFLEARDGTLWVGTRGGLARSMNGGPFEAVKIGDGSYNPTISDLEEDEEGTVWIATFGGLARAKGNRVDAFPPVAGFPFLTTSVALDQLGNVWTGTSTGVCRIPRAEFDRFLSSGSAPKPFRCFDESDGLRSRETDMGGRPVIHFRDGRLGFSTVAGVAVVHPEKLTSEGIPPAVHIQHVEADGTTLDVGDLSTLAPGTRQLRIDYVALTYVAPTRVRHRYKLEGYDRDWVEAGNRRSALYTNLPAGTYRFVVIAENGHGVWNDAGASLRIRQRAYFYQTVPFYLSVAGLVVGAAVAIYVLRVRQLKRTAAVLEERVEERTAALRERTVALRDALAQLEEKDARLHSDLMQARSFQRAMLAEVPGNESVKFTTIYEPAELIGGDMYDICELPGGTFRILIADTTGHGVQASLRTIVIKTEYERLKLVCERPSELLGALNRALRKFPESVKCSACCVDIHPVENGRARVVYANAAHPEILHCSRARGSYDSLFVAGMYLGMVDDYSYREMESEMLPGDALLLYSDGAIEELNADGVMFGDDRLSEAFRDATSKESGSQVALGIRRAIAQFAGKSEAERPTVDDMMLVLVELLPLALGKESHERPSEVAGRP